MEMAEGALFYFQDEITYEEKGDKKFLRPSILDLVKIITDRIEALTDFTEKIRALGPNPLSNFADLFAVSDLCNAAQDAMIIEGG